MDKATLITYAGGYIAADTSAHSSYTCRCFIGIGLLLVLAGTVTLMGSWYQSP